MNIKDKFLSIGRLHLQDDKEIRFLEDIWLGNTSLKVQHPNLFNIVRRKNASVAEIFSSRPLNVFFEETWLLKIYNLDKT
jgi:hypothetical protein